MLEPSAVCTGINTILVIKVQSKGYLRKAVSRKQSVKGYAQYLTAIAQIVVRIDVLAYGICLFVRSPISIL